MQCSQVHDDPGRAVVQQQAQGANPAVLEGGCGGRYRRMQFRKTESAMRILQGIADLNIVGFDVVEVSPAYDHADITALAGASLALQFLYMRASRIQ